MAEDASCLTSSCWLVAAKVLDDVFIIVGGCIEITAGVFKLSTCSDEYDGCLRARFGIAFAVLALVFAVISLILEMLNLDEGDTEPEDPMPEAHVKGKDILKVVKTGFTLLAVGSLFAATCKAGDCILTDEYS